jgi:lipid II:glycine glycyltransferase (peptidoglycan interpeptide bridge formation enzyme)
MNFGFGALMTVSPATKRALSSKSECRATSVYEVNPVCDPRWKAFVESHPQASVFHSTNWLKALQSTYGYEPSVVTTSSPGARLTNGLVFCSVKSWLTGRRLVSLPFSDHCEPLVNNSVELDDLLLHTKRYVEAGKWKYIEIRPIACQLGPQTGFGGSITYSFHRLQLRKSTEELFRSFHQDCVQRKIRRAEREKLQYEEGNSEILLRRFYDLLVVTRRRQHLPPQPLSWFRALIAEFGDNLKIRVASKDDLPIASILTITHKQSMVYKYGCSDARFHKFGGMALLFWNAIQEANHKGLNEFEMGRSDVANHGLIAFKEHWGAVGSELNYWRYPSAEGMTLNNPSSAMLRQFVRVVPDPILKVTGELFYRHIG